MGPIAHGHLTREFKERARPKVEEERLMIVGERGVVEEPFAE